jgi:hypothetical protein
MFGFPGNEPVDKAASRSSFRPVRALYLANMDTELCAHWDVVTAETEKPRLPLASRWSPCLGNPRIDQEATARAWGLLEALDKPPYPPTMPSLSCAIY